MTERGRVSSYREIYIYSSVSARARAQEGRAAHFGRGTKADVVGMSWATSRAQPARGERGCGGQSPALRAGGRIRALAWDRPAAAAVMQQSSATPYVCFFLCLDLVRDLVSFIFGCKALRFVFSRLRFGNTRATTHLTRQEGSSLQPGRDGDVHFLNVSWQMDPEVLVTSHKTLNRPKRFR